MTYKVVPFIAQISRGDTTSDVAEQLQRVINEYAGQGWEYERLEAVEADIAPDAGCFGRGEKPGYTAIFRMIVFKK